MRISKRLPPQTFTNIRSGIRTQAPPKLRRERPLREQALKRRFPLQTNKQTLKTGTGRGAGRRRDTTEQQEPGSVYNSRKTKSQNVNHKM